MQWPSVTLALEGQRQETPIVSWVARLSWNLRDLGSATDPASRNKEELKWGRHWTSACICTHRYTCIHTHIHTHALIHTCTHAHISLVPLQNSMNFPAAQIDKAGGDLQIQKVQPRLRCLPGYSLCCPDAVRELLEQSFYCFLCWFHLFRFWVA